MIKSITLNKLFLFAFIFAIIYISKDTFMLNQGDFHRAIFPFLNDINGIHSNEKIPLAYQLKKEFLPLTSFEYKSSYSYIIYAYAFIISLITNTFDMQILSATLKTGYILSLYYLFLSIDSEKKSNVVLFFVSCIPLIASSNLSLFTSFYQEQVLLPLLPICLALSFSEKTKDSILLFLCVTIISCSKSQFFYLPIIWVVYYFIFNRRNIKLNIMLMVASVSLAIMCMLFTSGASYFNKYHSTYFGIYQYMKSESIQYPSGIEKECVGIDSWGNKFDIEKGATWTNIGEKCLWDNVKYGFSDSIKEIIRHPSIIIKLPYTKSMRSFYGENYFHVYKEIKLIKNSSGVIGSITSIKDTISNDIRFSALLIAIFVSIVYCKRKLSGAFFLVGVIGTSQLYISFIGEGYRDINKHLVGMNYSFDILVFISTILIGSWLVKKALKKAGR